jgi:hypothetical protein
MAGIEMKAGYDLRGDSDVSLYLQLVDNESRVLFVLQFSELCNSDPCYLTPIAKAISPQ